MSVIGKKLCSERSVNMAVLGFLVLDIMCPETVMSKNRSTASVLLI